jgi:hypothetical protein
VLIAFVTVFFGELLLRKGTDETGSAQTAAAFDFTLEIDRGSIPPDRNLWPIRQAELVLETIAGFARPNAT